MIVAYINYKLPKAMSLDDAREVFISTSEKYRAMPDLVRKYYLFSDDGSTVGGVYLWKSREAAEKTYNKEWMQHILNTYGAKPSIKYFHSPVIVDNLTGIVSTDK